MRGSPSAPSSAISDLLSVLGSHFIGHVMSSNELLDNVVLSRKLCWGDLSSIDSDVPSSGLSFC